MAQGDVNNPNAWNSSTPTLGTGTVGAPAPQGGLAGDAPAPTDPDQFYGSYTLKSVPPTLGTGTVASPTGQGDVGDIEGFPDLANNSQVKGLAAFTTGSPTLVTQATTTPGGKGDVGDVGIAPTPQADWPDSAAGAGTLTSWNTATVPTLGLGTVTHPGPQGDIDAIYSPNEHFAGVNSTWQPGSPTLGTGAVSPVHGSGDISDPFAWQDTVLYLTSWPYPVVTIEGVTLGEALTGAFFMPDLITESENVTLGWHLTGGEMHLGLIIYSNYPPENITLNQLSLTGGSLTVTTGYVVYSNWPPENITLAYALTGGSLTVTTGYIVYSNWPPENITLALALTGGSLV